jgi:membrane protein implicated in regulation of membrane protease activity
MNNQQIYETFTGILGCFTLIGFIAATSIAGGVVSLLWTIILWAWAIWGALSLFSLLYLKVIYVLFLKKGKEESQDVDG